MKAITHDVFSIGLGLSLVVRVGQPPIIFYLVLAVWLGIAINEVIDRLGHLGTGGRSFLTHSIFTAPLWGIAVALASAYLLDIISGLEMTAAQALFSVGLGTVVAYSHLLLDALTEGGVYGGGRRIALAHMRYDNLLLNFTFTLFGVILILAALV